MRQSNKLCVELLPTYTEFEEYDEKKFVGYKLAMKRGENHYSIVTGLFRYKAGTIGPRSYSGLYKKEVEHYNVHLQDRLSIFTNKEDAYTALKLYNEIEGDNADLALLEITISRNLEKAKYSNKFVSNLDVIVGKTMEKIVEVDVFKYEKKKSHDTRTKSITLR
jgi:hypothetical protein